MLRKPTLLFLRRMTQRFSHTVTIAFALSFFLVLNFAYASRDNVRAYGRFAITAPIGWTLQDGAFSLLDAKVGAAYEFQFQTEGGLAPLKWSVASGALPPGLRLDEQGKLSGTPAQAKAEAYAFVVEVSDSAKPSQRFPLTCLLMVRAATLRILTAQAVPTLRIVTNDPTPRPTLAVLRQPQVSNQDGGQVADVGVWAFAAAPVVANAPVAIATAQTQPPVIRAPLTVGSKTVAGSVTATGDVVITITSKDKSTQSSPPLTPGADKTFSFPFTKALALGDEVKAEQTVGGQKVSSGNVTVEKTPLLPAYFSQPRVGDRQIEVMGKKGQKIEILVDDEVIGLICKDAAGKVQTPPCTEIILKADGANLIELSQGLSLQPGQPNALRVRLTDTDGRQASSNAVPIKGADIYNWGRARAYFSAGVVFSKERDSFSQQDMMLGFNLDKAWWSPSPSHKSPFKGFNTFFEARLTSIPVVMPTPTPPAGGSGSSGQSNTSDNQQCHDVANGFDCFLASRKVAVMQVGGYIPIYAGFMRWQYDSHENALFVAPLAKFGIQTITSEEVTRINRSNNTTAVDVLNGDSVYNFFAVGTRLGHYKLTNDANVSPELISYLDMTAGKWENFDLRKGQPCDAPANSGAYKCVNGVVMLGENRLFVRERKLRLGFEGRLKIPETPLFVGFDANLGKGPDDLRFVFGTRFDVGQLFGRLKYLQSLNK